MVRLDFEGQGGLCLLRISALFAYSWHKRKTHHDRSDSLSSVPCFEHPAFQTPVGAGLSIQRRGRPAVALRNLPHAISCAADTISHFALRALRELRQPGIATHRRGTRAGRGCGFWANPEIAGAALRSLPSQIFFRAAAATRKTSYSARAKRIEIARANGYGTSCKLRFTAERLAVSYWRNPFEKNQGFLRFLGSPDGNRTRSLRLERAAC